MSAPLPAPLATPEQVRAYFRATFGDGSEHGDLCLAAIAILEMRRREITVVRVGDVPAVNP